MTTPTGQRDSPTPRPDLVEKAAKSKFLSDFDWINDREAFRVGEDPRNRWLTAPEIRELAWDWILAGGQIKCVKETREGYRERRHYHYDITIEGIADFPRGLYVYMELNDPDENDPVVCLLNAHPSTPP